MWMHNLWLQKEKKRKETENTQLIVDIVIVRARVCVCIFLSFNDNIPTDVRSCAWCDLKKKSENSFVFTILIGCAHWTLQWQICAAAATATNLWIYVNFLAQRQIKANRQFVVVIAHYFKCVCVYAKHLRIVISWNLTVAWSTIYW